MAQSPFLPPNSNFTTQPLLPYPQSLQFISQQFNILALRQQQYVIENNYDEKNVGRTMARIRARRFRRSIRESRSGDNHLRSVTSSAVSTIPIISQVGSSPGQRVCRAPLENENPNTEPSRADRFPALTSSFRSNGANCTGYIRNDGTYGQHGQAIVASLRDRGDDSIFYSNEFADFSSSCPNWPNLTRSEKEHFWVWTVAAIVYSESTCRSGRISVRGTYGTAVGPMQMELESSLNRSRVSRAYPHTNCAGPGPGPQPDLVGSHANNLRCGLDVLEKQLATGKPLYRTRRSTDIYWQHLRQANGGPIGRKIRQNPNCVVE